jgi:hypothetical protein
MALLIHVLKWLVALLVGMVVNGAVVTLGMEVFPLEGLDLSTPEGAAMSAPRMGPEHFIFPWLAHAMGTAVGAFLAVAWIQTKGRRMWGWGIGAAFWAGGLWMAFLVPAPGWFLVADLGFAYLPVAWGAGEWAVRRKHQGPTGKLHGA